MQSYILHNSDILGIFDNIYTIGFGNVRFLENKPAGQAAPRNIFCQIVFIWQSCNSKIHVLSSACFLL